MYVASQERLKAQIQPQEANDVVLDKSQRAKKKNLSNISSSLSSGADSDASSDDNGSDSDISAKDKVGVPELLSDAQRGATRAESTAPRASQVERKSRRSDHRKTKTRIAIGAFLRIPSI
eukprot:scaffold221910_cov49-Prasinocladus_malaysianus.AAC.1